MSGGTGPLEPTLSRWKELIVTAKELLAGLCYLDGKSQTRTVRSVLAEAKR
jgi:hypothetical protein